MSIFNQASKIILISAVLSGLLAEPLLAVEDGFGPALKIAGKHFTIYLAPELEPSSLAQQLNITATDRLLAGNSGKSELSLADMLDVLFTQVCDILDMQLYSYQGDIKICRNQQHLNEIYNNLFRKDIREERSFYVTSLNTIYVTAENFKREIIGHEMGHAVISHYFVVLPSVKIQELLAIYVEYQLRKTSP